MAFGSNIPVYRLSEVVIVISKASWIAAGMEHPEAYLEAGAGPRLRLRLDLESMGCNPTMFRFSDRDDCNGTGRGGRFRTTSGGHREAIPREVGTAGGRNFWRKVKIPFGDTNQSA